MDAFIVDGIRTPIGSFTGSLSSVRADDLAAHAIAELMRRNPGIPPGQTKTPAPNRGERGERNVVHMV